MKTLNQTFDSMKFCSEDIFHFSAFTRLIVLEFQIVFLGLINIYMFYASIQSNEVVDSLNEPIV